MTRSCPQANINMRLRAVIYDFDGLIVDTETPEYHAWQEIFRRHGVELALEDWLPCIGTGSIFDPHAHMEALVGRTLDREEIALARKTLNTEFVARETLRPGVRETLEHARHLGLRIGLASSSSREWVEPHLERLGIRGFFECLQTRDLVAEVKPNPALYLQALDALGVSAGEALAFEDSLNGIRAARGAGIFVIAVPNAMTRHMDLREADLVVSSLAEAVPVLTGRAVPGATAPGR